MDLILKWIWYKNGFELEIELYKNGFDIKMDLI